MMNRIELNSFMHEILTEEEIALARKLKSARSIREKIIQAKMPKIDEMVGQKNDPMYMAYLVEYWLSFAD